MTGNVQSLFPNEEDRLFMSWRLAVRQHGQDSRPASDAWTAYIMSFIQADDRPLAAYVLMMTGVPV